MKINILRFQNHGPNLGKPHPVSPRVQLSWKRCREIAEMNTYLTTRQVYDFLMAGDRVYSEFSYFVLEKTE